MTFLFALLFATQVHAAEGPAAVIKEVDAKNKVIAIEPKAGTKAGDRWVWETDEESCTFQVYTVRGTVASARTEECESIKKVRNGQKVRLSLIDVEETTPVAKSAPTPAAQQEPYRPSSDLPTINESWYLLFGGGISGATYQGEYKNTVKLMEDTSGTKGHLAMSIDLGFYFPLKNNLTMIGGIIDSTGDVYTVKDNGDYTLSISQALYGASVHHFFGKNIGNGWFVRGDLGLAKASARLETPIGDASAKNKSGFGLTAGGGYSMPCGSETRVMFFLNLSSRHFGSDRFTVSTLGANFLF